MLVNKDRKNIYSPKYQPIRTQKIMLVNKDRKISTHQNIYLSDLENYVNKIRQNSLLTQNVFHLLLGPFQCPIYFGSSSVSSGCSEIDQAAGCSARHQVLTVLQRLIYLPAGKINCMFSSGDVTPRIVVYSVVHFQNCLVAFTVPKLSSCIYISKTAQLHLQFQNQLVAFTFPKVPSCILKYLISVLYDKIPT